MTHPTARPLSLGVVIATPLAILLLGLGTTGWYAWSRAGTLAQENGRGVSPPGFQSQITEPGRHTIWLHTETVLDGTAYQAAAMPPGAKLLLRDPAGTYVDIQPSFGGRKSLGAEKAVSVFTFLAGTAGPYSLEMKGATEKVVLSIAPTKVGRALGYILTILAIALGSFVAALAALVVLLNRRAKALRIQQIP